MNYVIIAGGREFKDYALLDRKLTHILQNMKPDDTKIVSGRARGADTLGEKWARKHGFDVLPFPADWKKYGKVAGHIRNEQMGSIATHLIAFHDGISSGTADMIDIARCRNLKIIVVKY